MSRYIDADALMEDMWSLYRDEEHIDYNVAIIDVLNVIDEQPTADVVPSRFGCGSAPYCSDVFEVDEDE